MNTLYLTVLRNNIIRFFRNSTVLVFYLLFLFWLLNFFALCIAPKNLEFSMGYTVFFVFFFSSFFWGAWAAGNTDPLTGLHTEKNRRDRQGVLFMTCLPMNRNRLYALQVLLYVMISAAMCIISFIIQMLFPSARSHINFIIYMHFLTFTILIVSGGLHSVLSLPFFFRGEMKDYKHPASIVTISNVLIIIMVWFFLLPRLKMDEYLIKSNRFIYIIDHPFILVIAMIAGILMLCLGGFIFKSIDIK